MAKSVWETPNGENNPWRTPTKKTDHTPVEFRKATYEKKSLFGKSEKSEGRAAGKASRRKGKNT